MTKAVINFRKIPCVIDNEYIWSGKYSELARQVAPYNEIHANVLYGQLQLRIKQIQNLGFKIVSINVDFDKNLQSHNIVFINAIRC